MTEPLTIKDLKCRTCSKRETLQCPVELAIDIGLAKHLSEVCGLACHPLALQVLARPAVEELERRIELARTIPKNGKRIEALKEAHALIKGGIKL